MNRNLSRMVEWLLLAAVFYVLASLIPSSMPQIQTLFWKLGHVTIGAFAGYWVDRTALGRIVHCDHNGEAEGRTNMLPRALILAACIIGVAGGL